MRIKIVDNPRFIYGCREVYKELLLEIAGKWVDVDTTFLFSDQLSANGLRIMAGNIAEIEDDMRPYRKLCGWCHHHSAKVDKKCHNCGRNDHFRNFNVSKASNKPRTQIP